MARDVRRWIAGVAIACGVIGIAYLPPRGGVRASRAAFVFAIPQSTPARLRAQELAGAWRAADGAARLLEHRRRQTSAPAARSDASRGPTIVLTGIDAVPESGIHLVTAAMDSAWTKLGLEDTKVRVRVVIELAGERRAGATLVPTTGEQVFLEPDSTDRTTCIALLPAGPYLTRYILGSAGPRHSAMRPGALVGWLKAGLGPCGFYATYGAPSKPVRRWLAARKWDVALFLDVDGTGAGPWSPSDLLGDPHRSWYWERIYSFPPATVACMAGRPAGCRAAVLEGASAAAPDSLLRVVRLERRWWQPQRLFPAERYLSDVARAVGRERFLSFWGSPLPVDTALATALKMPVGEWTAQWQRGYVPALRLGAAAPLGASTLALLLGAGAVMAVALAASRRQVR